jgi:hypothetical protein
MKYFFSIFTLCILTTVSVGQVEQGLIAKYYFNNESFTDEVGSIDGTPSNVAFVQDRFNNATAAIGFIPDDNPYVTFGDNFDIFSIADGSFGFSFWISMSDPEINGAILIAKYGNSNCGEDQREFLIRITENNKIQMIYYSALVWNIYRVIESNDSIVDTLWHHVVINYNGASDENDGLDRISIYMDNEQQETTLTDASGELGNIQNSTSHFGLGTALGSYGNTCFPNFYYGYFDDFRIYDRNLNSEEVDTLYNELDPFANITENAISFLNLNNFPNPFTTSATLSYELQEPENVQLSIYNHLGQIVYQTQENQLKGNQQLIWNAEGYADGVYYYRLQVGEASTNGKLVKVR